MLSTLLVIHHKRVCSSAHRDRYGVLHGDPEVFFSSHRNSMFIDVCVILYPGGTRYVVMHIHKGVRRSLNPRRANNGVCPFPSHEVYVFVQY